MDDKKDSIGSTVAQFAFYVLVILVAIWSGSLTLQMVARVLPGQDILKWFSLILFDGGALIWGMVYIYFAHGVKQRTVSLIMSTLDLLGVCIMVFSEILMGGQQFLEVPAYIGIAVVIVVGVWTLLTLIAAYLFHFFSIPVQQQILLQQQKDELVDRAIRLTGNNLDAMAKDLSGQMASKMVIDQLRRLGFTKTDEGPVLNADPDLPTVTYASNTVPLPKLGEVPANPPRAR